MCSTTSTFLGCTESRQLDVILPQSCAPHVSSRRGGGFTDRLTHNSPNGSSCLLLSFEKRLKSMLLFVSFNTRKFLQLLTWTFVHVDTATSCNC
jgi:hypothetical protein